MKASATASRSSYAAPGSRATPSSHASGKGSNPRRFRIGRCSRCGGIGSGDAVRGVPGGRTAMELVDASVGRDAIEPCARLARVREGFARPPRAEERVLKNVGGVVGRSEHAVAVEAQLVEIGGNEGEERGVRGSGHRSRTPRGNAGAPRFEYSAIPKCAGPASRVSATRSDVRNVPTSAGGSSAAAANRPARTPRGRRRGTRAPFPGASSSRRCTLRACRRTARRPRAGR